MRHKLISLLLAAILSLLFVLPAAAQDDTTVPFVLCGELDDADCAILEESALAMLDVTSSAFDVQFDASIGGIPELPADPIEFSVTMTGQWAVDDRAKDAIRRLGTLTSADPAAAAQTLAAQMPEAIVDLYGGLNLDASLTWSMPQDVADLIAADADVPFPPSLTWNVRMVDGMMYVDLSDFKALSPELNTVKADWIGFDMVGLMQMSLDQSQQSGDSPGNAFATGVATGAVTTQMIKLMQEFVTVERLDDVSVDNQTAAVFHYTPDLVGFLSSKTFRTEFAKFAAAAAGPNDNSTPELEKNLSMLGFAAPMIFRDLTVGSTTTIGLDDSYAYASQTEFKWDLSGLLQLAAMSDASLANMLSEDVTPAINFALDATYSQYNDALEFAAPEDVEIIPLDQMMPGDTSLVY